MVNTETVGLNYFIGIDMSKLFFDVGILDEEGQKVGHKKFKNTFQGFIDLLDWLDTKLQNRNWTFCMEHTGIYSRRLWMFLQDHDLKLWMESGFQIKRKSGIFKTKNDKVDAYRIAEYLLFNRFKTKLTEKYDSDLFQLHDLLANRNRIIDCIKRLKVPLEEIRNYGTFESFEKLSKVNDAALIALEESLQKIDNELNGLLKDRPEWKENLDLASSVKGIGKIVGLWIILYSRNFSADFSSRKFASLAGVAPFEISSGTSINGGFHVNCYSHKRLKGLFHIAVMASIRHNQKTKEYFDRKKKEGKKGFVVMNNIKNKLIHQVFAVVRSKTPFDENYIYTKAA